MLNEHKVKLLMSKENTKKLLQGVFCILLAIAVFLGAVCVVPVACNLSVLGAYRNIREDFSDQSYDCILVLGAGLRSDGAPSDMLADRLDVAIGLYNDGASDVILLSGDHSGFDYDEVTAMENYCIDNGIPQSAIIKDGKGYSTYESMQNLKNEGKYKKIVVVTQKYHLYRAIYISEKMGIEADGADAALRSYKGQFIRELREIAARTKDVFMIMLYEG